jgi:integrase/recombinase XerD
MAVKRKVKRSDEAEVLLLYECFGDFIIEKEARNLAPASIKTYKDSFIKFTKFFNFDTDTELDEVTQQHIYQWIGTMKQEGLSISSINHYIRDIRCFMYWCMDVDRAYVKPYKIQTLTKQEEPPKLFEDDEVELLLEKPRARESFVVWRTWAICNWVLGTGNRASTICNVKIKDVDFRRSEIVLAHTKNKKAQTIPLSSSLATILKEYIRVWRKGVDSEAYLFCNVGEEKLTTNALRISFEKYCKDRECTHTSIHGLRHNFAKAWVKNNGNMFVLQKILGHSTLDMTRRYVKLFGEDLFFFSFRDFLIGFPLKRCIFRKKKKKIKNFIIFLK